MKKRIAAAVAALALAMTTLSGCGGTQTETEPTPAPDAIGTVEENVTDTESNEAQEVNSEAAENEQSASGTGETAATAKPTKAPTAAQKPAEAPTQTQTPAATAPAQTAQPSAPTSTPTPVPTPTPMPQVSASEVMSKVMAALPNTYNLSEMPEEIYEGVYNINPSDYDSVSIYGAMINVKSNEVIVIKAKDANGLEKAKSALSARKKALEEQWKRYLEDQYQIVLGGKIVTKGLYAALIIAEGAQDGVNAFNSAF